MHSLSPHTGTTPTQNTNNISPSFTDVAISAPYEEESGAVYIYLGGEHGLSKDYSQRILGKSIKSSVRGFGFAISRGVDTDNNFHNDIAVGAYKSGDVVIIRSRPVIKFLPQLLSMAKELMLNTSEVTVKYCMSYSSSSKNVKKVDVNVTLSKDTRAKDNSDSVRTIALEINQTFCDAVLIMIQEGIFDYTKPFTLEMSYALIDPELSEFCANCPVTNPSDNTFIQLNIPFASGCGSDNICRPSLSLNVTTQTNVSSLIIGQLSTIKFHVQIRNDGEPAYISQLFMAFPEDVEILLVSSKCELNDSRIYECLLSNVLQPNVSSELVFEFDIKRLNPKTENLTFNVTVQSRGEEVNPDDNAVLINIPLRVQNGVEISGISFPDSIIFVNENKEMIAQTVEFTQEYYLKNVGPSPMSGMNATFYFPVEIQNELFTNQIVFGVYEPDVIINNQAVTCKTDYHLGFYSDDGSNGESSELDQDNSREENRFRRSVDASQLSFPDVFDLPANRTILVNCKSDNVTCMKITCSSSEILAKNQPMVAKFKFRARVDVLIQITSERDIILFSSTAESILESKTTTYHIPTILIGSAKEPDISYWFYIGGVFVALVILCIIVLILYKLNFFNRPVREKLQNEADEDTECKELEVDSTMAEEENCMYNT
ncbi:integrin alpha-PS5-like [Photinus pyralis]|uniref:integrin alpha-PS5-like n=1 Tax=Photinus pyralis TaxID=7054 RepID=UPI0012677702|nr:integrin alpha-PS5-like [Photinus pyralis]